MGQTQIFQFPVTSRRHALLASHVKSDAWREGTTTNPGSQTNIGKAASLLACYYHILPTVITPNAAISGQQQTGPLYMRKII
jgi:hypothetical protein